MNPPNSPSSPGGPERERRADSQPADAWLEATLRETAREHIDDAGFTARVREQLPAPRARRWLSRRQTVFAVAIGLSVVATLPFFQPEDLRAASQRLLAALRPLAELVPPTDGNLLIAGCVIAAGCLAFAARHWTKARG